MEEKNTSAQLEDDELLIEDDLDDEEVEDEDALDDEEDLVDDEEEYDFNEDDDDEDDAKASEGETADETESTVGNEDSETETEFEDQTAGDATTETEMREKMSKLLNKLGYHGTFEEAMAAYEADEAQKANDAEEATEKEDASAISVNYTEMAENSLRDINAAFGTDYKDFSKFDNLQRFAALIMGGATAIEAYRATQKQFATNPTAVKEEETPVGKPSKDHLKALPAAGSGETGASYADRQALASLRELYPERSVKDLRKTLERVKRARA